MAAPAPTPVAPQEAPQAYVPPKPESLAPVAPIAPVVPVAPTVPPVDAPTAAAIEPQDSETQPTDWLKELGQQLGTQELAEETVGEWDFAKRKHAGLPTEDAAAIPPPAVAEAPKGGLFGRKRQDDAALRKGFETKQPTKSGGFRARLGMKGKTPDAPVPVPMEMPPVQAGMPPVQAPPTPAAPPVQPANYQRNRFVVPDDVETA